MPIRDDVWNDLIDMEPGELKNRMPLAARWGGDAVVQELIEAGHLKLDGGRILRTKTSVDAASLWEARPEDGSAIGNQRARSELTWKSVQRFEAAKTLLVATGEIALGSGRGGSIRRKLEVASTPEVPKPPAAALNERRATKKLEATLWDAADELRGKMDSAQYTARFGVHRS